MWTIANELARCKKQGKTGVVATIVQVEGSAYQKEGAKCFITENDVLIGLLSGGCVESDIKEHAKEVRESRSPKTIHYDFRGDEDDLWGLGVGCNGAITIFLELYDPIEYPKRAELIEVSLTRNCSEIGTVVTVVDGPEQTIIGEKWMEMNLEANLKPSPPGHIIRKVQTLQSLQRKGMYILEDNGMEWKFFCDIICPVPKLLIFGAGPDAVPVAKGAKGLGWHVTVLDHRTGYLNQSAFQCTDQLVHIPAGQNPIVHVDRNTYIVIMSHHFQQDQLMLGYALQTEAPYIGILGPRHRTQRLLETCQVPGAQFDEEKLKRIHSPIGLDIGSNTPEEIALSILGELTACYRGGRGTSLKVKAGEIQMNGEKAEKESVSA